MNPELALGPQLAVFTGQLGHLYQGPTLVLVPGGRHVHALAVLVEHGVLHVVPGGLDGRHLDVELFTTVLLLPDVQGFLAVNLELDDGL